MTLLDVMIAVGGYDFADGNGARIFRTTEGGKHLQRPYSRSCQTRRYHRERRHASRRHPDHSTELVLDNSVAIGFMRMDK